MKQLQQLFHHSISRFNYFKAFVIANACIEKFLKLQNLFKEMIEFQDSIQY